MQNMHHPIVLKYCSCFVAKSFNSIRPTLISVDLNIHGNLHTQIPIGMLKDKTYTLNTCINVFKNCLQLSSINVK